VSVFDEVRHTRCLLLDPHDVLAETRRGCQRLLCRARERAASTRLKHYRRLAQRQARPSSPNWESVRRSKPDNVKPSRSNLPCASNAHIRVFSSTMSLTWDLSAAWVKRARDPRADERRGPVAGRRDEVRDDAAWESVIEHGIPDRVGIALVASIGSLVF